MFCYISLRCGSIFYVPRLYPQCIEEAYFAFPFPNKNFSHRYNKTNFKFMIFVGDGKYFHVDWALYNGM